jgi:hypothetical protein
MSVPLVQGDAMLMNSKSEHRTSNAERPTSNGKGTRGECREAQPKVAGGFAALVAQIFLPAGSGLSSPVFENWRLESRQNPQTGMSALHLALAPLTSPLSR